MRYIETGIILFFSLSRSSLFLLFKPPAPCRWRLYVFGSSVRATVRPCVRDSRGSFMFPQHLQYLLTDLVVLCFRNISSIC